MANGYQQQPDDKRDASALVLECVIPDDFDHATTEKVRNLLKANVFRREVVQAPGRPREVYSWNDDGPVRLVDIPTTLRALRETAVARLGRGVTIDMEPEVFQALQEDEIRQFVRALRGLITSSSESTADIRQRACVLPWKDTQLARL